MLSVLERPRAAFNTTTSEFIIESHVALPPRNYGYGRPSRYPFALMEVGDSFAVPLSAYEPRKGKPSASRLQTSLSSCAASYGKANRRKFTVRKVDETSVRIWRIA